MLLHRDAAHLFINLMIQTLVAVPLEAEQGVARTAFIYIIGGVAGRSVKNLQLGTMKVF